MANNPFKPARKEQSKLKLALSGPSGSGKTWSALEIATRMAELANTKIAFIDTEGRAARKYAGDFTFDVLDLSNNYAPTEYIKAIRSAEEFGYGVLVIDSMSHAWNGKNGVLEIVDMAGKKKGGNDFAGWADGRPQQNNFVAEILASKLHIIGTMRTKTEWLMQEKVKRDGKTVIEPVKVGLSPVQSSDFEYEFDVVLNITIDHELSISKTRCRALTTAEALNPTFVAETLHAWLTDGEMPPPIEKPMVYESTNTPPAKQPTASKPAPQTRSADGVPAWFNTDNINRLADIIIKEGVADADAVWQQINSMDLKVYDTGKDAGTAIRESLLAQQKPATPKAQTPEPKQETPLATAGEFVAQFATYRGKDIVFMDKQGFGNQSAMYYKGRGALVTALGETFANANDITLWEGTEASPTTYEIAKVTVAWKQPEGKTYRTVTSVKPFELPMVTNVPSDREQDLDNFFGNTDTSTSEATSNSEEPNLVDDLTIHY